MRQDLETTLTKVGVGLPPHPSLETLVQGACMALEAQQREVEGMLDHLRKHQQRLQGVLIRLGRPPGAHALIADMIGELAGIAEGRLTGPPPEHAREQ